ncbi:hypothetical protein SDJN02_14024, partial [Cucurbita argyrosperma subsp. argyrosperma]
MASRQDYGSSNFQGEYLHSEDLMHILRRHHHVKWRYALEAVGNSNRFHELDCKMQLFRIRVVTKHRSVLWLKTEYAFYGFLIERVRSLEFM